MSKLELTGWNHIVNTIIKNHFNDGDFTLQELYKFEQFFKLAYPKNTHIKPKIRQTLQNLRDYGLVEFKALGVYRYINMWNNYEDPIYHQEVVYLLSNDSMPNWVKIGRTKQIDRRLKELYSTSVPTPFKLEATIETNTLERSIELEKSIHSVIDTINPSLRKDTEASRREFFNMSAETGKHVFDLVSIIMGI